MYRLYVSTLRQGCLIIQVTAHTYSYIFKYSLVRVQSPTTVRELEAGKPNIIIYDFPPNRVLQISTYIIQ